MARWMAADRLEMPASRAYRSSAAMSSSGRLMLSFTTPSYSGPTQVLLAARGGTETCGTPPPWQLLAEVDIVGRRLSLVVGIPHPASRGAVGEPRARFALHWSRTSPVLQCSRCYPAAEAPRRRRGRPLRPSMLTHPRSSFGRQRAPNHHHWLQRQVQNSTLSSAGRRGRVRRKTSVPPGYRTRLTVVTSISIASGRDRRTPSFAKACWIGICPAGSSTKAKIL